jgi:hypothetical protein
LHLEAWLEKRDFVSANSMTSFFDLARKAQPNWLRNAGLLLKGLLALSSAA